MRNIVNHTVRTGKVPGRLTFAVVSDLHAMPYDDAMDIITACDAVLAPGDLTDRHFNRYDIALRFLRDISDRMPLFYSLGNHEVKLKDRAAFFEEALKTRAVLLDNSAAEFRGIWLGGISSVCDPETLDFGFLSLFENKPGYRLLMCHHPEIYMKHVSGMDIDLTVSGHAHGGQVQIFGRGLFAPGQGFFPKYTHGTYDNGKLLVSRGFSNSTRLPRFNNPCELILLTIEPY